MMENPVILVVDADPKNLQILREGLESSGFTVLAAVDGQEAWEKVYTERPDLILSEVSLPKLDGFQLLERIKQEPTTAAIPIMFLTNRREIQDRVRSLRGGVKDYMIKPLHVKEVIARIRMILRRMERMRNEEVEPTRKLVGRLEEYSVADLIENFGVERKSGVLSVYNENNKNGEIYFRNGAVVHATLGTLKAEKAVYQMLPWRRGHFIMTFKEVQVEDTISVSNLGLLLHGFKRIEEREKLFKMLPSPETTCVLTDNFRKILSKKELSVEAAKFLTLIDGKRDIMQIIDESSYDDLKTLERLVKLYQQGFIKPGSAAEAKPAEIKIADVNKDRPIEQASVDADTSDQQPPPENGSSAVFNIHDIDMNSLDVLSQRSEVEARPAASGEKIAQADKNAATKEAAHPKPTSDVISAADPVPEPTAENEPLDVSASTAGSNGNTVTMEEPGSALTDEPVRDEAQAEYVLHSNGMEAPAFTDSTQDQLIYPEPLSMKAFKPDLDILEAIAKFKLGDVSSEPDVPGQDNDEPTDEILIPTLPTSDSNAENPDLGVNFAVEPDKTELEETMARHFEIDVDTLKPDDTLNEPPQTESKRPTVAESSEPSEPPGAKQSSSGRPVQENTEPAPQVFRPIKTLPRRGLPKIPQDTGHFPDIEHIFKPGGETVEPTGAKLEPEMSKRLERLLEKLAKTALAPPAKFVLIGAKIEYIEKFSNFVLENAPIQKFQSKVFEYLGVGEREVGDQNLVVVGVSMEQQFTQLLDSLADGFAGYALLIEANSRANLDYVSYLYNALKKKYKKPFAIALVESKGVRNFSVETVRDLIGADKLDLIQSVDLDDSTSMLQFLQAMLADQNLRRWQEKNDT
ncbi:MAG: response regulator [candidate division KSB1 bacterium]|nr:response regulator [candidate division KSB1 bacterium]